MSFVQVEEAAQQPPLSGQNVASIVRARLAGVRSVTISAPGILLDQWTPHELQVSEISHCVLSTKRRGGVMGTEFG